MQVDGHGIVTGIGETGRAMSNQMNLVFPIALIMSQLDNNRNMVQNNVSRTRHQRDLRGLLISVSRNRHL